MHAIDKCIDFWQPGVYCSCTGEPESYPPPASPNHGTSLPNPYGQPGRLSRGQDPLSWLSVIAPAYAKLGIPPSRLSPLLPWFGCNFQCLDDECIKTVTGPTLPEWGGGQHGSICGIPDGSAGVVQPNGGPGYGQIVNLSKTLMVGDVTYNKSSQLKSFRWRAGTGLPMQQVTYDDPETVAFKARWLEQEGFMGVGFWLADATGPDPATLAAMWDAVPS